MATKQKYYVLENGEYVMKYKDSFAQGGKEVLSPDRTLRQEVERNGTPKSTNNTASFNQDTHPLGVRKQLTHRKFGGHENEQSDRYSYSQCNTDKQPDERLCHITLQLTSRINKLEEENEYLRQENRHFSMKLSFSMERQGEYKEKSKDLENQLEEVRFSYQEHMKMYNELCVAYEGLAEENRRLLEETRVRDVRKGNSKTRRESQTNQMESISEDGENTFRTLNAEEAVNKAQFKMERYVFELDLLKHQIAEKDEELNDILDQLRMAEDTLTNSKLTEDFLVTELEKTKAIVYNQKLLEQALNEKIARILDELRMKESILSRCECGPYHLSQNKGVQATKIESDQESNIN